jgi:cytochrome c oxidase subunit IV
MSEHTQSHTTHDAHHMHVEHTHGGSTKTIWKTFWILLFITVFEVGIAFTGLPKVLLKWTFILLTIVKSYYIVGYFMHLKYEKKHFAWTILLPFILIVYFIFICLYEGEALGRLLSQAVK